MARNANKTALHLLRANRKIAVWLSRWAIKIATIIMVCASILSLVGYHGSTRTLVLSITLSIFVPVVFYSITKLYYTYSVRIPDLERTIREGCACPVQKPGMGVCPLGVEKIFNQASETLLSIFDTKKEYHFVGLGSENVLVALKDSHRLSEFRQFMDKQSGQPVEFHFVVRDNENYTLMEQEEDWRFPPPEKRVIPLEAQIANAINHHNELRKAKWFVRTYKAETLADFRIVIVDDVAYVSFNEKAQSSQAVPQLLIRNSESPLNLYRWFRLYVELREMDVERRNRERITSPSIIEPISKRGKLDLNDCAFCKIVRGESKELYDTVLFQTKNFVVIPAKGHFAPGYVLLVPKKHHYSFAGISDRTLVAEFTSLLQKVQLALKKKFEKTIVFEHGSIYGGGYAGSTIDHAHLHIVPCAKNLCKALVDDGRSTRRITEMQTLRSLNRPYLFVEDQTQKRYAAEVEHELQGQYLRHILYDLLYPKRRDTGWDWHSFIHEDLLYQTLKVLRNA